MWDELKPGDEIPKFILFRPSNRGTGSWTLPDESRHDGILMCSSILVGSPTFFHCIYFLLLENGHLGGMLHESVTRSTITLWKGRVYLRHLVRFAREREKSCEWQFRIPETDPCVLGKRDLHSRDGSSSSVDEEARGASALSCLGHCPWSRVPHLHAPARAKTASGSSAELAKHASPNFHSSFAQSRSGRRFQTVLLVLSKSFFSHGERVNGAAALPRQYSSFPLGTARGASFLGSSPLPRGDMGAPAARKSLRLPWSWRPSRGIYAA